jgi:hypothetical protein
MTLGAFEGFEQQAGSAFDRLVAGGLNSTTALQSIAPLLAQLRETAQTYGLTLDANTESLLAQAQAAGVAFPTDPMQQVVDILRSIATALGAEIPESAQRTANALTQIGATMASSTLTTLSATQAQVDALGTSATAGLTELSATASRTLSEIGAAGTDQMVLTADALAATTAPALSATVQSVADAVLSTTDTAAVGLTTVSSLAIGEMARLSGETILRTGEVAAAAQQGLAPLASAAQATLTGLSSTLESELSGSALVAGEALGATAESFAVMATEGQAQTAILRDQFGSEFTTIATEASGQVGRIRSALNALSSGVTIPVRWDVDPTPDLRGNRGGGGGVPGAAAGALVTPRPGGSLYRVGEGGSTEVIAPVRALLQEIGGAIAAQLGGSGRAETIVLPISLGTEKLTEILFERSKTGHFRVHENAIVRR